MDDESTRPLPPGDETEPVWRLARANGGETEDSRTAVGVLERPALFPDEPEPEPERRRPPRSLSAFLAAVLGAVLGSGITLVASRTDGGVTLVAPPARGAAAQATDVAALVQNVLPSMVRVDVTGEGAFGRAEGTGSGVIYRSDGYIVTNNHVVAGADQVQVRLSDGTTLAARVVGTAAPAVDIALLKVDRALQPAVLGSTKDLKVGSLAIAIGSPFGLQGTVTAGVISALHRNITLGDEVRFTDAIQTDAPINPGNSGGALVDGSGRVVGINTAILSGGGGGNVGVGFAIPIEIVREVADQVIRTGKAVFPFLGISGQNLPNNQGALIQDVVGGGPADRAGIRAGDIIVRIDGVRITSMDDVVAALFKKRVGDSVKIEYLRDKNRRSTTAVLGSRPEG